MIYVREVTLEGLKTQFEKLEEAEAFAEGKEGASIEQVEMIVGVVDEPQKEPYIEE